MAMDDPPDFKLLQDQIQSALIDTTRTSGYISAEDLGFQRSLYPDVATALKEQSIRAPSLDDADDIECNWRSVVDVVDSLLEKSDTSLDEYAGVIKRNPGELAAQAPATSKKQAYILGSAFRTQNIVKPQLSFENKPNNNDKTPWKPLLTTKPHAILSLEQSLKTFHNEYDQTQYRHPYETEISQLKYPESVYLKTEPIPYLPIDTTSAIYVDTEEGVTEMLKELKSAREIAVDLEHHDNRSYIGLVSLMQISTRHKDWIIDTLKPWRQNLQVLNEVFADPKIVKVFHGAFMDIMWLQRDLGLYIVGLFDTHSASRALGYAGGSLAFLLKKFIDFDADKKYQMADWRIRPLPDEMLYYARADTHYLLYIYDNMRNELVDRSNPAVPDENRLEAVLQKSKEISLYRYERQVYNEESGRGPGGWYQLLVKTPALFNNEQFAVFRAVHAWRDRVARIDDDSPAFVMPQHVVFSIAKLMPKDAFTLLNITRPIPHSVKSRTNELLEVIKLAQQKGISGPSMVEVLRPNSVGVIAKASLPSMTTKNEEKSLVAMVDEGELRSDNSLFWGQAFGSSMWDAPSNNQNNDVRLAVPLPALSSELYAAVPVTEEADSAAEETIEPNLPQQRETDKQAFVLNRSAHRKPSHNDAEELDPRIAISRKTKKRKARKHRLAQKKAGKFSKEKQDTVNRAASSDNMDENQDEDDDGYDDTEDAEEEPFDYSKAESVLHSNRVQSGTNDEEKRKKKPFDPYSKSSHTPKGMRKAQTDRVGKSQTFKN